MATLQGDLVDAVTAGVSPISKDDSPISASDVPNGVSALPTFQPAKKELADVTQSVDSPDVTRTDCLDEVISLPPKVEADIPHVDLNEADNNATEDKALEPETTIAVAHSDDKKETEHPITDRKDTEGLDFKAEVKYASAEPVPTEDKADGEVDNTSTHPDTQLDGEESFVGADSEETKRDSVADEDEDVINVVEASAKLPVDELEAKDVSHDETPYEDELKQDVREATSELTVSSTEKPSTESSEPKADTPTVVDNNATEIEAPTVSDIQVPHDTVDLNASKDVVLPEPKEDTEEAHAPVSIATPTASKDEAPSSEPSTEVGAVDEAVKGEEKPEAEIPVAVDEDLTSSTEVIAQDSTSSNNAQHITEDEVSESIVEDAEHIPAEIPAEGASSVPTVEVITKEDNEAILEAKKDEVPQPTESEESKLDIQQDEQPDSVEIQDDLVSDEAQEPIATAVETITEEVVPPVEPVAEEREGNHVSTESDDGVVEVAAESKEDAVPSVELASEEPTKESDAGGATAAVSDESQEEAAVAVESAIEEPKEEAIHVEDEDVTAVEVEEAVPPVEKPVEQSIPVPEEVHAEDELKDAAPAIASHVGEVEEAQVPEDVARKEETTPADLPVDEQTVAPVTEVVPEQSEEKHAPTVETDDKSAEELTVAKGEDDTVEPQEETSAVDELTTVDPVKETIHEEAPVVEATTAPQEDIELTEEHVGAGVEETAEKSLPTDASGAAEVFCEQKSALEEPREEFESSETAVPTTEEPVVEATPAKDDGAVESSLDEVNEEATLALETGSEQPVEDTASVSKESKEEEKPAVELISSEPIDDAAEPAADETHVALAEAKEEQAPVKVEDVVESDNEKPEDEAANELAIEDTVEKATPAHEVVTESSPEQVLAADSISADSTEDVIPATAEAIVESTAEEPTEEVAEESQDATPLVDSSAEDTSEDSVQANVEDKVVSAIVEPTEEAALAVEPITEESQDATPPAGSSVQDTTENLVHTNVEGEVESSAEEPTEEAVVAAEPLVEGSTTVDIKEDIAHTNVEDEVESSVEEPTKEAVLAVEPIANESSADDVKEDVAHANVEDEVESFAEELTKEAVTAVEPIAEEPSADDIEEDLAHSNVDDEVEFSIDEPRKQAVEPPAEESSAGVITEDLVHTNADDEGKSAVKEPVEAIAEESSAEDITEDIVHTNVEDEVASALEEPAEEAALAVGPISEKSQDATLPIDSNAEDTTENLVYANHTNVENEVEPAVEEPTAVQHVAEESKDIIPAVDSSVEDTSGPVFNDIGGVESSFGEPREGMPTTEPSTSEPTKENVSAAEPQAEIDASENPVLAVMSATYLPVSTDDEFTPERAFGDSNEAASSVEEAHQVPAEDVAASEPATEEPAAKDEVAESETSAALLATEERIDQSASVDVDSVNSALVADVEVSNASDNIEEAIPATESATVEAVKESASSLADRDEPAPVSAPETVEAEGTVEKEDAVALAPTKIVEDVAAAEESLDSTFEESEEETAKSDVHETSIPAEVASVAEISSEEGVPTVELSAEDAEEQVPAEVEVTDNFVSEESQEDAEEVGEEQPAFEKPKEELLSALEVAGVEPTQASEPESAQESGLLYPEHPAEAETASLSADKPTIAINTDVVDSAEIDTPSLITDATSAAGSSARPWTPSFQVTTVGRSVSPVPEVEIADAQTEDLSVPATIANDGTKHEGFTEKTSTDVDAGANLIAPPPWTPSYAVHSQGSPMLAAAEVDANDGAVHEEDIPDVSEIEFAENPELPVAHTINPVESVLQESETQDSSAVVTSGAVDEEAPTKESIEVPQERETLKALPEAVSGPSIVEPVPETAEELSTGASTVEHAINENVPSNTTDESVHAQEHASIWVPSYSVSRQGSPHPKLQELSVSVAEEENSLARENVEHAGSYTTVVESSEAPEDVAVEESTTVHAIEATEPAEVPEIVAEEKNTPVQDTTQATESPALVIETSEVLELADANEVPALEGLESTRSLDSDANKEQLTSTSWVPSYSVSRQGSPLPEVRSLGTSENENEPAVAPAESFNTNDEDTNEVIERPTTPAVIVTPEDKLAPAVDSLPERPWTPSYSVISQGPGSPAKSSVILENPAEIGVKPTDIQVEAASTPDVAVLVDVAKANIIEDAPKDDIVKDQTPFPPSAEVAMESSISTLPPVDENAVSDATSSIAESTPTVRKRLESTTSSRFFPGGWFSPSPKVPHEGRTSLEIAQGEFTSPKAVPTDDVSDIVPDSASESSTAPDDNATEADDEKKRGKWCVIM